MKIRQLEYFMHVVTTLNITHAAERANISQPALSRQIQLLEDELSTQLIERRPRGVALTAAGQRLADHVRGLMQNVDLIKEDILSTEALPMGTLRIAAAYSLRGLLIADVVAQFHRLHPQVSIEIQEGTSSNMRDALVTGRADLAIYSDHGASRGLNRRALCSESLVLLASADELLRLADPVPLSALTGLQMILTPNNNGLRRVVDDLIPAAARCATPPLIVETNSITIDLVSRGGLHSILPYSACHQAYRRGEISIAPILGIRWPWVIATSRDRHSTAAMRVFSEILTQRLKTHVESGVWQTAQLPAYGT